MTSEMAAWLYLLAKRYNIMTVNKLTKADIKHLEWKNSLYK